MKIGFDIDDTLNDIRYTGTRIFNEYFQCQVTKQMMDASPSVHIYEAFNLAPEEGHKIWRQLEPRIHEECLPLEYAVDILQKLEQQGHDIFYITARENNPRVRQGTINWLHQHGFPFKEDHLFIGMKDEEKADIAQKLGLDLFFDDKPHVLAAFAKTPVQVYLKETSYNKHASFQRISCWSELEELVRRHQNPEALSQSLL